MTTKDARKIRRRGRWTAQFGVLLASAVVATSCAGAPNVTISSGVRTDYSSALLEPGDDLFVVQFEATTDFTGVENISDWGERGREVMRRLQETAATSQKQAIAAANSAHARYASLWISNSLVFAGSSELGAELAKVPGVKKVWHEEVPSGLEDPNADPPLTMPPPKDDWDLSTLHVPQVQAQGIDGTGIAIGIIDTGVAADHEALAHNFRGRDGDLNYDWWSPLRQFRSGPVDLAGHGTAVAGLAVGTTVGVATGAEWIAGIACSENGCPLSGVVHAMQFMLAPTTTDERNPRPDLRPHIVNSSWVRGSDDEPLQRASAALAAAGIFQVYAAGNEGPSCGTASPVGEGDSFLSIGAVTQNLDLATFSARGPANDGRTAPDAVAPGDHVLTSSIDNTYRTVSGTSFAAPLVAGVAALVLQANPQLIGQPSKVADILRKSAHSLLNDTCGSAVRGEPNDATGWGLIDASAAVEMARTSS